MNILFVTPSLPNRFHRIRALNLIKYLSFDHKIFLISLETNQNYNIEELKKYCTEISIIKQSKIKSLFNCLLSLFTPVPLEIAFCSNKKMNKLIDEAIKKYDINLVYLKRLRTAQYIDSNIKSATILDTTDAMSMYYKEAADNTKLIQKLLFIEEGLKYKNYESKMFKKFNDWIACSKIDIDYLKKIAPQNVNFYFIPNGVDSDYYNDDKKFEPEKNTLIFSGLMDKFVNIEASKFLIKKIFPLIQKSIPNIKLYIVGPNPPKQIKKLANKNILITGKVDNLKEYILKSSIVLCPIQTGAGTRNKILQAWSLNRPVVTTSKGVQGILANHYEHVLIADKSEDFANQIIILLKDEKLQNKLTDNSKYLLKTEYAMEQIIKKLNLLINQIGLKNENH